MADCTARESGLQIHAACFAHGLTILLKERDILDEITVVAVCLKNGLEAGIGLFVIPPVIVSRGEEYGNALTNLNVNNAVVSKRLARIGINHADQVRRGHINLICEDTLLVLADD